MELVSSSFQGERRYLKRADKADIIAIIQKFHYSVQLPHLTREYLGYYNEEGSLIGGITLGWGTRPKHTIKKLWEELDTNDYYEIGKMAVDKEVAGHSSASHLLSLTIRFIKEYITNIKVLFTWADGMLGKAGYVYQSANFYYAGKFETDSYFSSEGERVHPRTSYKMNNKGENSVGKRPTLEQLDKWGWSHYKGFQFKYVYFIHKSDEKQLLKTSKVAINRDYPKDKNLRWKKKMGVRNWVISDPPNFKKQSTTIYEKKVRRNGDESN